MAGAEGGGRVVGSEVGVAGAGKTLCRGTWLQVNRATPAAVGRTVREPSGDDRSQPGGQQRGLSQSGGAGDGEKWSEFEFILKI